MAEGKEDHGDDVQVLLEEEETEFDYKCGELRLLSATFNAVDDSVSTVSVETATSIDNPEDVQNSKAVYGPPLDSDEAAAAVPEGAAGLLYHSIVVSLFSSQKKRVSLLYSRHVGKQDSR